MFDGTPGPYPASLSHKMLHPAVRLLSHPKSVLMQLVQVRWFNGMPSHHTIPLEYSTTVLPWRGSRCNFCISAKRSLASFNIPGLGAKGKVGPVSEEMSLANVDTEILLPPTVSASTIRDTSLGSSAMQHGH